MYIGFKIQKVISSWNKLEIQFIELEKINKIDEKDALTIWTAFLNDPNNEKLVKLEKTNDALHEAKVELARISRDPKVAEIYRMRENALNEKRNALSSAEDKGREEGKKEGEYKANISNAKKMIKEGLDVELVSRITGLSLDEIKNINK